MSKVGTKAGRSTLLHVPGTTLKRSNKAPCTAQRAEASVSAPRRPERVAGRGRRGVGREGSHLILQRSVLKLQQIDGAPAPRRIRTLGLQVTAAHGAPWGGRGRTSPRRPRRRATPDSAAASCSHCASSTSAASRGIYGPPGAAESRSCTRDSTHQPEPPSPNIGPVAPGVRQDGLCWMLEQVSRVGAWPHNR